MVQGISNGPVESTEWFLDSIGGTEKLHIRIVRGYEITFDTLSANDINFGAANFQTAPQPPALYLLLVPNWGTKLKAGATQRT